MDYRIELQNAGIKTPKQFEGVCCRSAYMIPVILIPGIESPFRGLNLNHNFDEGTAHNKRT